MNSILLSLSPAHETTPDAEDLDQDHNQLPKLQLLEPA